MSSDELKSAWKGVVTPDKSPKDIELILRKNDHPVLKKVRRQSLIEIIGWVAFLVSFYTLFDGAEKSVFSNGVLVSVVVIAILHNVYGYTMARHIILDQTLKYSLEKYLSRFKVYSILSITSRVLFIVGLILFFTSGLEMNAVKIYAVAAILFLSAVQLFILYRIWARRLATLRDTIAALAV